MGIPPTGLLAAIFLLGEKPTVELLIGGLIIIGRCDLNSFKKKEREENESRLCWSRNVGGKLARSLLRNKFNLTVRDLDKI